MRKRVLEHAAMAEHSDETRALLDRLRRIADDARNIDVADADAVHYDFSPYNILASTDPRALALYAAHMVLPQVDWSLRHHDEGTVEWFLGIGTGLLHVIGAH